MSFNSNWLGKVSLRKKRVRMKPSPLIDIKCQFCGKQCFLPLIKLAPANIIEACATRRVNALATCEQGQAMDRSALGYCYDDIVAAVPHYERVVRDRYGQRRPWRDRPIREWRLIKWVLTKNGYNSNPDKNR